MVSSNSGGYNEIVLWHTSLVPYPHSIDSKRAVPFLGLGSQPPSKHLGGFLWLAKETKHKVKPFLSGVGASGVRTNPSEPQNAISDAEEAK